MRLVLTAILFTTLAFACGHDDGQEAFDTYQACFDDHTTGGEMLPVKEAIVICCLEHPIAGHTQVCGATTADCMTYLSTNLAATSATPTEVSEACTDYITQKGM